MALIDRPLPKFVCSQCKRPMQDWSLDRDLAREIYIVTFWCHGSTWKKEFTPAELGLDLPSEHFRPGDKVTGFRPGDKRSPEFSRELLGKWDDDEAPEEGDRFEVPPSGDSPRRRF